MLNSIKHTDDFSDVKSFVSSQMFLSADVLESLDFLLPLSDSYPNIEDWFINEVAPGLHNETRKLFVYKREGEIVALGIAKRTDAEKKICTVRVSPEYVGKGLGIKIFKEAMQWLGTTSPHLTVSEDRLDDFQRIFNFFDYKLTSTVRGLYIKNKVEYFFNDPKSLL